MLKTPSGGIGVTILGGVLTPKSCDPDESVESGISLSIYFGIVSLVLSADWVWHTLIFWVPSLLCAIMGAHLSTHGGLLSQVFIRVCMLDSMLASTIDFR